MKRLDIPLLGRGVVAPYFLVSRDRDISREWNRDVFGAEVVYERDLVVLKFHSKRGSPIDATTLRDYTLRPVVPLHEGAVGTIIPSTRDCDARRDPLQRSCNAALVASEAIAKARERRPS